MTMKHISTHDNVIDAVKEMRRLSETTGQSHVHVPVTKNGRVAYEVRRVQTVKEMRRHLYGEAV
ncbi:hypothetical protein [Niveispirillum sp. KHB5.9]|uniref:hypothetical protein n=1 Tax=Niveispirillum sp. KHB5.9 TaxID=3400269 RepID=UPI003A8596AF